MGCSNDWKYLNSGSSYSLIDVILHHFKEFTVIVPISIILQLNEPLGIEHQFKWTNKLSHTTLGEPSKYEQ